MSAALPSPPKLEVEPGECHVLREVVLLRDAPAAAAILVEVRCLPCITDGEDGIQRRTSGWMTPPLWGELMEAVAPLAEGEVATALAMGDAGNSAEGRKQMSSNRDAAVLNSDRLRLACIVRKNAFAGMRVVASSGSEGGGGRSLGNVPR